MKRALKERMSDFLVARFEDSNVYTILVSDYNQILLEKKSDTGEKPRIMVFLHPASETILDYQRSVRGLIQDQIYVTNVFYKDGDHFMVRLGVRGRIKGNDRSLKNYSYAEVNRMIHLRGFEKEVLDQQGVSSLVYYQPETERLEEAIKGFDLLPVTLDYSHLSQHDNGHGFAENHVSLDYKVANETYSVTNGGLRFRKINRFGALIVPL